MCSIILTITINGEKCHMVPFFVPFAIFVIAAVHQNSGKISLLVLGGRILLLFL